MQEPAEVAAKIRSATIRYPRDAYAPFPKWQPCLPETRDRQVAVVRTADYRVIEVIAPMRSPEAELPSEVF